MAFRDLGEFFDDTLALPVDGKTYVVPAPDAELGLYCQALMGAGFAIAGGRTPKVTTTLNDDEESQLYARVLGRPVGAPKGTPTLLDELKADGVTWPKIQRIAQTALMWIGGGLPLAQQYWESGDPKAPTPAPANRAARRSRRTAAATTTKPPASTSGTRSRRASSTT